MHSMSMGSYNTNPQMINMMMQQQAMGGPMAPQGYNRRPNTQGPQQVPFGNMGLMPSQPRERPTYDNKLSLYIGNLTQTTFDNDLFKFFKNKGFNLRNAQVMLNRETRKSKCFGYLNFYTEDEANRCLTEMNNATLNGRQVVLSKKKSNSFDSQANIIILNIAKELNQANVYDLCKPYGNIVSCKLETLPNGTSKGFCYVQYETKESAQKAIDALTGQTHHGKQLQAKMHSKKSEREDIGEHFRNLYVKNIPANFTVNDLQKVFQEFGKVVSCSLAGDGKDTGFVMFETHDQAVAAIEGLNAKREINGKTLFVSKFISLSENVQTKSNAPPISQQMNSTFKTNIFVRNIPKEVSEEEFSKTMGKVGKIISLKMKDTTITGDDGKQIVVSKIGYVCYENVEDAQVCIRQFDQTRPFGIGSKALSVEFWKSKYDLQQENEEKNINQVKKFIHEIK